MTQADVPARAPALLHPGLVASGATLLIAAFVTDVLYWKTDLFQWNNVSGWLLAIGLVFTALAAIAFVLDLALRHVRAIAWLRFAGLALAAVLALVNVLVHSRDAYTAVVPEGIALSAVTTLILVVVGVGGGWSLAYRRAVPLPRSQDLRT